MDAFRTSGLRLDSSRDYLEISGVVVVVIPRRGAGSSDSWALIAPSVELRQLNARAPIILKKAVEPLIFTDLH